MEMFNAIATLVVFDRDSGRYHSGYVLCWLVLFEMPTRSSSRYYHLCYT